MESVIESILRKLIFWEKEDKPVGRIIRFIHYGFMYFLIFFYLVNHTLLPSYGLFMIYYCIFLIIFIQHLICRGCVVTMIERRLLGDKQNFINPLLELFHVPTTPDVSHPVFMLLSCLFMCILTFELMLRTILYFS
jgi:hypothetical protein